MAVGVAARAAAREPLARPLFTLDTAFIQRTPLLWCVYLGYRVHTKNAFAMVCLPWIPRSLQDRPWGSPRL